MTSLTYLLDTDVFSVWQSGTGPDHAVFLLRLSEFTPAEVGVSVVSFQEQALGCHAYLSRAKTPADVVRGYLRWGRVIESFRHCTVVGFDETAAAALEGLRGRKLRVGTMDLRIAATALSRGLTLVTRNVSDFGQVPGLRTEDWTR